MDSARAHYGTADSRVKEKLGVGLTPIIIGVVILVVVVVLIWYFWKDTMMAAPTKHMMSLGTSNMLTGGNSPQWAHGSHAAGGHLDSEMNAAVSSAGHWLHKAPASGMAVAQAAADRDATMALMGVSGGVSSVASDAARCPPPSWDALEDMRAAQLLGSVDPTA